MFPDTFVWHFLFLNVGQSAQSVKNAFLGCDSNAQAAFAK